MESGIEAPSPSSFSEKQSISCSLAVDSTSLALSSALSSTMSSASSSGTSLALTVASTESLEVVNTLSTTSSFAPMDTGLRPPVFVISPSSSPVQTSSMLTFASSMTSSTFSSALVNTISDGLKEPESSIASESNITQVSSLQDDCNPPKFVPILGAWAKPLLFKPPATPSQPSTPREYDPAIVGNQLAALWPCTLPPGGLVHAVTNRIWGRSCKISCKKIGEDSITAKPSSNRNPTTPKVNANHFITTVEFDDPVILDTQVLEDKDIVEPKQQLLVVDQRASANNSYHSDFDQETSNRLSGTLSPSHLQHEEPTNMQIAATILSTLVDSRSTPIDTQIMESSPSNITNNVVLGSSGVGAFTTSPVHCSFESPSHFAVLGDDEDEVEIEPSSQFSLTRGGRESKAPIKYHNMEWKTVRGRGNRGRRGRSSSH
ncbi:hypothetical protein IGI04_001340 [Brassica rapa subsp. trilocularis]|uniref:Uncharacterized protein n=1 Tax=Brassica rapa subsp. trilocularis TaxID=1813537 RepID=A0ABQ7NSL4_BRACM|nr:hypothetical protein IGI04_001340 [Brassica rapa subsp. trilocularis]